MVLSSLPPSPVSITAKSTPSLLNHSKAMAVVISKNDSPSLSISSPHLRQNSATNSRGTIVQPEPSHILALSRKSTR